MAGKKAVILDPVETALRIVREKGSSVPTRELLELVATQMKARGADRPHVMAEVHTALCLDNRLANVSGGWILQDWAPKPKVSRAAIKASAVPLAKKKRKKEPPPEEEEEETSEDELDTSLESEGTVEASDEDTDDKDNDKDDDKDWD